MSVKEGQLWQLRENVYFYKIEGKTEEGKLLIQRYVKGKGKVLEFMDMGKTTEESIVRSCEKVNEKKFILKERREVDQSQEPS